MIAWVDSAEKSEQIIEKLKGQEDSPELHYHSAIIYWDKKKYSEAINECEKAVQLNPSVLYLEFLTYLYVRINDEEKIQENIRKVLQWFQSNEGTTEEEYCLDVLRAETPEAIYKQEEGGIARGNY